MPEAAQNGCDITVGIPTKGRESLTSTIMSVVDAAANAEAKVKILVVINGEAQSTDLKPASPLPNNVVLATVNEPRKGYATARNAILANLDSRILAMVDDDEIVSEDWIKAGMAELERFDADVVTGPVNYILPGSTSSWILRRSVFKSPLRCRGQLLTVCSSNNLFVDVTKLTTLPNFDEKYNRAGGEDTDWTFQLHKLGARIVWSPKVTVSEFVDPGRLNRRYVRKRFLHNGKILALTIYQTKSRLWLACAGILRMIAGVGKAVLSGASAVCRTDIIPHWDYNESEALIWRGLGMLQQSLYFCPESPGDVL